MANTDKIPAGRAETGRYEPPIADTKKLCTDLLEVVMAEMDLRNITLEEAYDILADLTPYDFGNCDNSLVARLITHFKKHENQELIFCEAFTQLKCELKHKMDQARPNGIAATVAESLMKFLHSSTKPS